MADPRRVAAVQDRLAALRGAMAASATGAVLLDRRRNFAWLTAGGANHVVLDSENGAAPILVTASEAVVLAPVNEADRLAVEEVDGLPIEVEALPWHEPGVTADAARRWSGGRAPVSDDDVEADLQPLRSRLGPMDRERLEWLAGRVRDAVEAAVAATSAGDSEQEVAARAAGALLVDGVRAPVILAAADERIIRFRHPLATTARVARRLMLVVVAERWGLHAAITRIRELEPPPEVVAQRMAHARDVESAMLDATRPGATLGEVFAAAQRGYAAAGVPDEWLDHHQGGTIGYGPRERIATPGDATAILPGMAFAWNPSIAGAKVEDTYLLDDDGTLRRLT